MTPLRFPSAAHLLVPILTSLAACSNGAIQSPATTGDQDVAADVAAPEDGSATDAQAFVADADASVDDAGVAVDDAGATVDTSPTDTASGVDAGPPADVQSSNKTCTFNSDCIAIERCECDEATGCFCKIGPRGTGKSGVDTCTDGNDCVSSLCAEGPGDVYYCSGPCGGASDCGPKMPICANVAFIGKICIRDPKAQ